jgi:hypothetical protein
MPDLLWTVLHNFSSEERVKLRRYLVDRLRCELGLSQDQALREVAALEARGVVVPIDISHYDPAAQDITIETALVVRVDAVMEREMVPRP